MESTAGHTGQAGGAASMEKLNARFGAPGRIVFRTGFAGYPTAVLANQYGTAEVALLGGNVLSYRPTGHPPVLFRPAKGDAEYNRGDKFHGGIPVCWPQFGNRFSKELPQHGFASKLVFDVRATEYSEEKTELTLGLKSTDETRKLWPHDFDLELKVSVTMKLNLSLTTRNTGSKPFEFSCGFHPYFLLRDRDAVSVRGIAGLECILAQRDGDLGLRNGDIVLDHAPDDVFALPDAPKHEFAVVDPGLRRAIAIVSTGNTRQVVWNCGDDAPCDMSSEDWRKFVCVEPVSDWPGGRTLAPGEVYVLAAAIQSSLEQAGSQK